MSLTFPTLSTKNIVEFLVEGGYAIGEQELLKPTRDAMWPLYEYLMQYLMGISREELQQPVFSALEHLEFAELHEDSVGCLASFRNMAQLMQTCNVPNFSMNDIIKPDPDRTIHNLSAIINFAKFKEERDRKLSELTNRKEKLLELREQAQMNAARVKAQVQALQTARLAEQPAVQALQDEIKQMKQQIVGYNKQHAALRTEQRGLKEEYTNISDQISHEKFLISQAKQLNADLKGQIVQSPEKLQKLVEEKQQSLENAKKYVEERRLSTRSLKKKQEAYGKAEEKVKKCVAMLNEYEKQTTEQKQVSKEVKALKSKVKECEKERRGLETRLAQSRLEGQHLMEQAEKSGRQAALKLSEAHGELQTCLAENTPLLTNLTARIAHMSKLSDTQNHQLAQKLAQAHVKKEAVLSEGAAEIARLQNKVRAYNKVVMEEASRITI